MWPVSTTHSIIEDGDEAFVSGGGEDAIDEGQGFYCPLGFVSPWGRFYRLFLFKLSPNMYLSHKMYSNTKRIYQY